MSVAGPAASADTLTLFTEFTQQHVRFSERRASILLEESEYAYFGGGDLPSVRVVVQWRGRVVDRTRDGDHSTYSFGAGLLRATYSFEELGEPPTVLGSIRGRLEPFAFKVSDVDADHVGGDEYVEGVGRLNGSLSRFLGVGRDATFSFEFLLDVEFGSPDDATRYVHSSCCGYFDAALSPASPRPVAEPGAMLLSAVAVGFVALVRRRSHRWSDWSSCTTTRHRAAHGKRPEWKRRPRTTAGGSSAIPH